MLTPEDDGEDERGAGGQAGVAAAEDGEPRGEGEGAAAGGAMEEGGAGAAADGGAPGVRVADGDAVPEVDLAARFLKQSEGERAGFSAVYRNAEDKPVPVSWAHHYAYRDVRLHRFTALEFRKAFTLRKMTDKDREWWDEWKLVERWKSAAPDGEALAEADEEGELQVGEQRRTAGRPCERYVLRAPHPLHNSHILVVRAKWDTVALAGAPPPKLPAPLEPGAEPSRAQRRAQRDFARYFVANFTPWGPTFERGDDGQSGAWVVRGPKLDFERWDEWEEELEEAVCLRQELRLAREDGGDDDQRGPELESAKRERLIAAGRLFDLQDREQ